MGGYRSDPCEPALIPSRIKVSQHPAQMMEAKGLSADVRMQSDPHYQRLPGRLPQHLLEVIDSHVREILGGHEVADHCTAVIQPPADREPRVAARAWYATRKAGRRS